MSTPLTALLAAGLISVAFNVLILRPLRRMRRKPAYKIRGNKIYRM